MSTRRTDSLASLGIDINSRSFLLDSTVDEIMLRNAWQGLAALGVSKPVTVFLNSGGGDLDVAFSIYDLFQNFEQTLNIVVLGSACSAASLILQAADMRLISQNSYVMCHQGTTEITSADTEKNIENWCNHYKQYSDMMFRIYADKMKQPVSKIKKLLQSDQLYIGEAAVKAGLVDAIWTKI
jgi:ATP-dependent Clp protease protease subunit